MIMKIHEPGELKRKEDEKRYKEERLRAANRLKYTRSVDVIGVWDSVYKEGSVPKTKYSI